MVEAFLRKYEVQALGWTNTEYEYYLEAFYNVGREKAVRVLEEVMRRTPEEYQSRQKMQSRYIDHLRSLQQRPEIWFSCEERHRQIVDGLQYLKDRSILRLILDNA